MERQKLYEIALTLVPGVGDVNGKKLVAYCGGAEAVFCENRKSLMKIPGIGENTVNNIVSQKTLLHAENEMRFIERNGVKALFYLDQDYPKRLQHCHDSPMMLYYKGNADLNAEKVIGVVGTRNVTEYGKYVIDKIVGEFSSDNVLIISGLAYGVDTMAHKSALKYGLATVGVLGHGLQIIYPAENCKLAHNMLEKGGVLTEFLSSTKPDRENFPKRNRIVAGMIDCLIVAESAMKGGAMITAEIANSYDREVFAIPGRIGDAYSEGCNNLVKTNKADILLSAADVRYIMRWDHDAKVVPKQMRLFRDFSDDEKKVIDVFGEEKVIHIDQIIVGTELTPTKIASILLSLEFDGVVTALPGKRYQICDGVR
ncbi:MAG: DNA-processing protein DprA [Bacteroidales bacterium]|nr:DNA-processing protein DprA [Bacteroidales bacterium]